MTSFRAAAVCLMLLAAGPAVGQRPGGSDELARLQAEHHDEQTRARRLRADAAEAGQEIARLDRELVRLNAEARDEDGRLAEQRARLAALGRREAALVAELSGEQARQGRLLSALQMMSRRPPPPLLIPADQAVDTVRAAILIRAATPVIRTRTRALADRQAEIARVRRLAALSSEALFTAESAQLDRRGEIQRITARRGTARAALMAEADRADRAAAVLETRIRGLGGTVRPLAGAEARVETAALPGGRSRLTPPLDGAPLARDGGLIWRGEAGQAVGAPAAGTVDFVGPLEGWGVVVILRLGPGWRVVLAGLDTATVGEGASVADGAPLGRLPDTPGADLYLEVRRDDRAVEASRWFD